MAALLPTTYTTIIDSPDLKQPDLIRSIVVLAGREKIEIIETFSFLKVG